MRTDTEINNEIVALKNALNLRNRWNAETRELLNAQIRVLTQRMTTAAVEREWYVDETTDEYQDGDNFLWGELDRTARWMLGEDEDAPSHDLL
jgi:hypothetical protein